MSRRSAAVLVVAALLLAGCGGDGRDGPDDEMVARGAEVARQQTCITCHAAAGSPGGIGPTWDGLWGSERTLVDGRTVVADRDYLERAIREPDAEVVDGYPPLMPAYPALDDEDLDALLAYLEHLR